MVAGGVCALLQPVAGAFQQRDIGCEGVAVA